MAKFKLFFGLAILLSTASSVLAQDPFGDDPFGNDPFGATDSTDQSGGSDLFGPANEQANNRSNRTASSIIDPIAWSVYNQSMDTPEQIFAAVETLYNLNQRQPAWEVLNKLTQPLTAKAALDFVTTVSSPRIFWLMGREDFPVAKKAFFDQTLRNAMQFSSSDELIGGALDQLIANDAQSHAPAFDRLQAAGMPAATNVLNRMQGLIDAGNLDSGALRRLVMVVQQGGNDWDLALRSMVDKNLPQEAAAILGLAARPSDRLNSGVLLGWINRSADQLPEPKLEAMVSDWKRLFASYYGFSADDKPGCTRWLTSQIKQQKIAFDLLDNNHTTMMDLDRMAWIWEPKADALTIRNINRFEKAARDHSQLTISLLRLDAQNESAVREYLTAQLQAAKVLAGLDIPLPPQAIEIASKLATPQEMTDLLQQSMEQRQWVVAQAILEALTAVGSSDLLIGYNGHPAAVINALRCADQRVRFAATHAILKWQPTVRFAGSSYFNRSLFELLNAPVGAQSVVASMNQQDAYYLAAMTRSSGWDTVVANNSQELMKQLEIQPIQFAIVTDALGDDPYLSVIDRIRATPKGSVLPIALMVRKENLEIAQKMFRIDRVDPNIVVCEMLQRQAFNSRLISEVANLHAKPQMPMSTRQEHALNALLSLKNWLAEPKSLALIDFPTVAPAARNLIGNAAFDSAAVPLLAYHGNPDSQVFLANLASDTAAPNRIRSVAAQAFRMSVQKFGTLMTTAQLRMQYDRQNRSAADSEFTQQLLNSILDTLEARFKSKSFDQLNPIPQAK